MVCYLANLAKYRKTFKVCYNATHFVALDGDNTIATGRYREITKGEIKIERMTTKKEFRTKGIGTGLLSFMLKDIKKLKPKKIWLRSQVQAQEFYERQKFKAISEPFGMYGKMHIDMEYVVK